MSDKTSVYASIPVDMLTWEQAKRLQAEIAGALDPETQEPVFNNTALNGLEDDPQRAWKHLSRAMTIIGECDAVIFPPGWNRWPGWICPVEQDAALRSGKRCLYTYRDSAGTLRLLNMGHCGGPEKREEEDL